MADNLTIPATGAVVSTDDAGASGHVQRMKLAYSADGSATHVTADANGLLVSLTNSTSAVTSVNDQGTSTTLLSASATRKAFRIYNDSTSILYVKYGTTASTTDYTVQLGPNGFLIEDNYNGRVDGIWSADASGAAKITDLSA